MYICTVLHHQPHRKKLTIYLYTYLLCLSVCLYQIKKMDVLKKNFHGQRRALQLVIIINIIYFTYKTDVIIHIKVWLVKIQKEEIIF